VADAKISALPSATLPLAGTEVLPIVQGGVTDKVTAADLLRQAGQTVTASNPILDLAQTWNNAAVDFTGWLLNVTNTTSGGGSLLLDLRLDDVTQLSMSKGGDLTVSNSATIGTIINTSLGAVGAPAYTFTGDLNTGIYGVSADVLGVTAGGSQVQSWGVGTSTLTGLLRPDADNTRDLATAANALALRLLRHERRHRLLDDVGRAAARRGGGQRHAV
jgi:hypothetical protein